MFDDLTEVHHRDGVGDLVHEREVVGDDEGRQPESAPDLVEELDDLGLDRHIERGHRLIGHDEVGIQRQRPGDGDPLPLAARELGRIAVGAGGRETHRAQELLGLLHGVAAGQPGRYVKGFGDDPAHLHLGIQGGEGVLEDHLHPSPVRAQPPLAQVRDVIAVEDDPSPVRLDGSDHGHAERGLARPALADQPQRLARFDRQRHPVDGAEQATAHPEADGDVVEREQRFRH